MKASELHQLGTPVTYWPIRREDGKLDGTPLHTKTRSEVWKLGHGAEVVLIDGMTGGVSIEHLVPMARLRTSGGGDPGG